MALPNLYPNIFCRPSYEHRGSLQQRLAKFNLPFILPQPLKQEVQRKADLSVFKNCKLLSCSGKSSIRLKPKSSQKCVDAYLIFLWITLGSFSKVSLYQPHRSHSLSMKCVSQHFLFKKKWVLFGSENVR